MTAETCAECGFDARRWRVRDAASLLGATGHWWALATAGVDDDALNLRPQPDVWSVLEYGVHVALVTAVWRMGLELILGQDGVALPDVPDGGDQPHAVLEPAKVLADVGRETAALAALATEAPTEAWAHTGREPDGSTIEAEAGLLHVAHDVSHHMLDVSRILAAGAPARTGTVTRVNASDGGVPKHSIGGADVTVDGIATDRQADRKHHGRPFQALCLWSADVIGELQRDGHPIEAGSAGENVTVAGVDWAALRPGTRLRIGTVVVELSFPATPCKKQTRWFADGDFRRIDHERNPGLTRWYAWVREPGRIDEGDPVEVRQA